MHRPSWLCCPSNRGLSFLRAACCNEEDWDGHSFSMLLDHLQCPFCDCPRYCGLQRWEHLLTECQSCKAMAFTWDLKFVPAACDSLGLSLALFTMSHHMASFVWLLMEHLQACHCPRVVLSECRDETSSISSEVATAAICSNDSDFGMQGIHRSQPN